MTFIFSAKFVIHADNEDQAREKLHNHIKDLGEYDLFIMDIEK